MNLDVDYIEYEYGIWEYEDSFLFRGSPSIFYIISKTKPHDEP